MHPWRPAHVVTPARRFGFAHFVLTLLLAALSPAHATSVVAPSFPELVDEAQLIVRARVVSVRSAWSDSPQGRVIKTHVTLAVQKSLKGNAPAELTLQLLGGEIDGQGMRVAGMPRFTTGQTDILFISGNGVRFCPLVGLMHGRYKILTDPVTAREYVARNDDLPLVSAHAVPLPHVASLVSHRAIRAADALTPAAFEQTILDEVSRRVALP